MNGTYDSVGVTITNATVIAAIAVALRTAVAYGPVTTNGRSWAVGACGGGSELSAAGSICACPNPQYIVRPCIGSLSILASIIRIIALITSRILLLKIYASCLWLFMIIGIAIGIIFTSQVNDFLANDQKNNPHLVDSNYYQENFLLGMNGGLTLLMSVTILVGIIILHCLISDTNSRSYIRSK
ncbi:unnamed protein product [Rotaria magnacalcarata]|uniref:Uncharacterized protein n=1 Tax=Rotaria magnacalcarata TaxID=392030 RepID=A0A816TGS0_9BILA|nr:unnamed protein product [Rotaria magnacalcarata]